MIVNTAEPKAIRMFVRKPALLWRISSSTPMIPPTATATSSRRTISVSVSMAADLKAWHPACTCEVSRRVHALDNRRPAAILWVLGFSLHVAGGLIHLLLVIALVVIVLRLLTGRRV